MNLNGSQLTFNRLCSIAVIQLSPLFDISCLDRQLFLILPLTGYSKSFHFDMGFHGRIYSKGRAPLPPFFSWIYSKNYCNQLSFERYCAIKVVLSVCGEVLLSPNFFRPPLFHFSGSNISATAQPCPILTTQP